METNTTTAPVLDMAYVLTRIDQILTDKQHVQAAIEAIAAMPAMEAPVPDARPAAIAETVRAREETNRQLLTLLAGMYGDLKPRAGADPEMERLSMLMQGIKDVDGSEDYKLEILQGISEKVLAKGE